MIALDWCTTHLLISSNVAWVINQICQSPISTPHIPQHRFSHVHAQAVSAAQLVPFFFNLPNRFLNKVTAAHDQATRFLLVQFTQQGLPGSSINSTAVHISQQSHGSTRPSNQISPSSIHAAGTSWNAEICYRQQLPEQNSNLREMLTQKLKETEDQICSLQQQITYAQGLRISQLVAPSFQTSINGKSKSQGVQRHQERQKQRLERWEMAIESDGEQ
ncbi:hypothetical protein F511_13544 [Dorcoceras hygrometricum]|uniref:Uncharacterized protein n=1 Tax=Dorcoceras hygrometricum TaxID=472368 RepID=A0A2Z7AWB7_9LAMI|nr:hypothetical protein F511_13544 [Dorcoceras hygrometricum]